MKLINAGAVVAGWILLAQMACSPRIEPSDRPAPGTGDGASTPEADGGAFGFVVPDGGTGMNPPATVPEGQSCAQATVGTQQVAVDLLVLLDNSGSMTGAAGTRSKWQTAQAALVAFVKDRRSAGLGVGVQFFPQSAPARECKVDGDCSLPNLPGACQENEFCDAPPGSRGAGFTCLPISFSQRCPLGGTCRHGGLCTLSQRACQQVGQPCASGIANDLCREAPRLCLAVEDDSCNLADYQEPAVGIAALPGNEDALVRTITARTTAGGTPTGVALQGAFAHLRAHLAAHPGRRAAVILATDGIPSSCAPADASSIAGDIAAARASAQPIATYVIGVFSAQEMAMARAALQLFATAGGTGMPFLLNAGADLGQALNEALDRIRGEALPCEFAIPPPTGGSIDYGRVNMKFEGAAGEETVPYAQSTDRCDPARGGWYYDVDPAAGTPTRLIACPATCARFKAESNPRVSLVFGCKTKIIE
jgi:hypothetical protein